jgi:hypothetical protein
MKGLSTSVISGNFIQQIKTVKGPVEFNFLRKKTLLTDTYFILVVDAQLKAYWFSMLLIQGKWRIIDAPKVPNWICDIEEQLSEAIHLYNLGC